MKNKDWQNLFGRAPESFLNQVDEALDRLKEEKSMKRRYKASTILIAAALTLLMTGAALAAGLGLIGEINRRGSIQLLPGAEQLVESNLGSLSTEYIDLTVESAVWDGRSAFVQVRLAPKNPEEYALLPAEYVYEEWKSEFIFSEEGWDFTGVKGEFLGHRDGKKVVRYAVTMSTPDMSLGYWDVRRNEDGSVTLWMDGSADSERRRDTNNLTISLGWGVHGEFTRDDAPFSWNWEMKPWLPENESVSVTMNNAAQKTKVTLEEAGESEQGIIRFLGGEATFTPLKGYCRLSYLITDEAFKGRLLSERFMDAEGNALKSTYSLSRLDYDRTLDLWKYDWEGDMQSFDPIPESLYFYLADIENGEQVIDRVKVRLVPAE